jgi:hypothetical protein
MSDDKILKFEDRSPQWDRNYFWTKVKDKLPLYKQCILVVLDNKIIAEAVYRGEYEKNEHVFRLELLRDDVTQERVSHWMPLLPLPKEEKNNE